ncbi:pyridoxamine 5'-phosphate oxidase family protein [Enemella sp. A6]|uniref:pyridoxamine 5'-phosphate oxidase family protein n=1 Tax=Enemella sp. A6 TaxID=3440152 RepID=UPI003EB9F999
MGDNVHMAFDESGAVTNLSEQESWELLSAEELGRLATAVVNEPEIYPVNFVVDDKTIVFRTAEGSKLLGLTVNNKVAFEVDGWDGVSGWSVLVRGQCEVLEHTDEIDEAEKLPLKPWVPTIKKTYVRIRPIAISGRRFRFGEEPPNW